MLNKIGFYITIKEENAKKLDKKDNKVEDLLEINTFTQVKNEETENIDVNQELKPIVTSYRALWIIDEKNNVLIRIEDDKGNIIKQIPPDEIIRIREKIKEFIKVYNKTEG